MLGTEFTRMLTKVHELITFGFDCFRDFELLGRGELAISIRIPERENARVCLVRLLGARSCLPAHSVPAGDLFARI